MHNASKVLASIVNHTVIAYHKIQISAVYAELASAVTNSRVGCKGYVLFIRIISHQANAYV